MPTWSSARWGAALATNHCHTLPVRKFSALKDGEIHEEGTRHELIASGGRYPQAIASKLVMFM